MPRRRDVAKREVPPDPIYNSTLVTKFVRCVMNSGKRSTAEGLLYGSLDIIRETHRRRSTEGVSRRRSIT